MSEPEDRFDALLEAMLTKPPVHSQSDDRIEIDDIEEGAPA
jgi:hypothetical protein